MLIGALGVDVLPGGDGNDVLIGGTEDFNSSVDGDNLGSDNRDRAFGGKGDDIFIWAPGDGSDFYVDGAGIDNVEVLDITTSPATIASLSDLPLSVQAQIQ